MSSLLLSVNLGHYHPIANGSRHADHEAGSAASTGCCQSKRAPKCWWRTAEAVDVQQVLLPKVPATFFDYLCFFVLAPGTHGLLYL